MISRTRIALASWGRGPRGRGPRWRAGLGGDIASCLHRENNKKNRCRGACCHVSEIRGRAGEGLCVRALVAVGHTLLCNINPNSPNRVKNVHHHREKTQPPAISCPKSLPMGPNKTTSEYAFPAPDPQCPDSYFYLDGLLDCSTSLAQTTLSKVIQGSLCLCVFVCV